jgi:hypothetical protein
VGAPWPGSHHCSNAQSWVAPLRAETTICVMTPGRLLRLAIEIDDLHHAAPGQRVS